jgi:hypothetical protein
VYRWNPGSVDRHAEVVRGYMQSLADSLESYGLEP